MLYITEEVFVFAQLAQGPAHQGQLRDVEVPASFSLCHLPGCGLALVLGKVAQIVNRQGRLPRRVDNLLSLAVNAGKGRAENRITLLTRAWNNAARNEWPPS